MALMYDDLTHLLLLDVVRRSNNHLKINNPKLRREAEWLVKMDFLSNDSNTYSVTEEGKKTLLLFDDEKRKLLKFSNRFKEVYIDGETKDVRPEMASFMVTTLDRSEASQALYTYMCNLRWDDTAKSLAEMPQKEREKYLTSNSFITETVNLVDLDRWKSLGKDIREAVNTAQWLLS